MQRLVLANINCAGVLIFVTLAAGPGFGQEPHRQLTVHLAQANNDSPYAFVRARFEPGEVTDPWAVRFFDQRGKEVPYFVWDWVTWKVAREGRADWGHRYALLNHHPGDAPEALHMRPRRLAAARQQLPQLGAALATQDEAAKRSGDSVCAALYLVRHRVPAFGKDRLTLRCYPTRQTEPRQQKVEGQRVTERLTAAAGALVLDHLPDRPAVRWKGKELFRYAGFKIGAKSAGKDGSIAESTHADPTRPFAIEIEEGIITRLFVRGQTNGRGGAPMNWQCTCWLFPEGSYVALTGFSLDNTAGYLGGGLSMAVWEMPKEPEEVHEPLWEKPWWLHQLGDAAFVAVHQFADTPLAVGYGNNPFNVSTPASLHVRHQEKSKGRGDGLLELHWTYELTDKRIYRLFHPRLDNDGSYDLAEVTDLRETLLTTGRLTRVPRDATGKDGSLLWPPERVRALEEALRFVKWRPKVDWLYRQYVVGVGERAADAESAVRQVLGAAAGWVDRPFGEDEIAELIVRFSLRKSAQLAATRHQQAWTVLPATLRTADRASVGKALLGCADPMEIAAGAMDMIRKHTAAGGTPIQGTTKGGGEGWHNNPAYAGVDVPVALRFMDHFQLYDLARHRKTEYRRALLEWADFSLETLGGKPLDWDKLRTSLRALWPNRVVMLVPLMLRAFRESNDGKYARAARLVFDEVVMGQVETNPHGYFWAWGPAPRKAEWFDPNYNVAAYDRGIIDFWSEGPLSVIGKERACRFAAAQARYLVISGQFLDTWETDSMTAIQSHFPGGIPSALGQLGLFLHDDFLFYRGLVGEPIRWGVIDDGGTVERREGRRNMYTQKIGSRGAVFWAYGIGRETPSRSRTAREMLAHWLAAVGSKGME
jgi:hypothetical protein